MRDVSKKGKGEIMNLIKYWRIGRSGWWALHIRFWKLDFYLYLDFRGDLNE